MKKILIALDGSKGSESVLPYVEALLRNVDANVTVATVAAEGRPTKGAQTYLSEVATRLARKGAFVDTAVLSGRPAEALVRYAGEERFDLLAMCSRGKKGLKRMVLGSVAEEILRHTAVPVLVVHPREEGAAAVAIRKIAVPLDGSHRSAAVLGPVTDLAKALGARVEFVSIVSPTQREALPVETVAHNIFEEQKVLQAKGVPVELSILYGDPATEILSFAENRHADLVAIATHGRTGLKRTFYGSVAEKVLRKGTFPLLVVRNAAVVRTHPMDREGNKARRRALATVKSVGEATRSPYSG